MEFAVALPFLVLLTAIAVDFGRVFYSTIVTSSAAYEGAYYAQRNPSQCPPAGGIVTANGVYTSALTEFRYVPVAANNPRVECRRTNETGANSTYGAGTPFASVRVTVTYDMDLLGLYQLLPEFRIVRAVEMRARP